MADAFGNSVENCSFIGFSVRWHVESAVFWIHFSVDFGQVFMWQNVIARLPWYVSFTEENIRKLCLTWTEDDGNEYD